MLSAEGQPDGHHTPFRSESNMKRLPLNDIPCEQILRSSHLFTALDDAQMQRVLGATRRYALEENEVLFEARQPAISFYVVLTGQIRLYLLSARGDEKVVELVHAGQSFAEAVMFMDRRDYPVSAAAVTPTELLAIENRAFLETLQSSVETCLKVLGEMSMRLRRMIGEIDFLTQQNAEYRLVNYLLQLISEDHTGQVAIRLETPKSVIASRLSIKPETFSRILHRLSEQGIIEVDQKDIRVQDVQALRRLAG